LSTYRSDVFAFLVGMRVDPSDGIGGYIQKQRVVGQSNSAGRAGISAVPASMFYNILQLAGKAGISGNAD